MRTSMRPALSRIWTSSPGWVPSPCTMRRAMSCQVPFVSSSFRPCRATWTRPAQHASVGQQPVAERRP
jgi:hypothetical protein